MAVEEPRTQSAEPEWKRRERLARIFGDVHPSQTSDDRDDREEARASNDAWLKSQVPPHHGG